MKNKFYPLIIAALMFVTGCEDTFYDAYNDLTGPVESILLKETTAIYQTKTELLKAEVYPSLTENKNVIWSTTPGSGSVSVDQNGLVTGVDVGSATVTATSEENAGISASCLVSVASFTAPAAPSIPTLIEGTHQISVSWAAVTNAELYEVWYRIPADPTDLLANGNVTGLNYTITGLVGGKSYYVWVKAKNTAGTSTYSPTATSVAVGYALRDIGPGGGYVFYDAGSVQTDATYGNWRYMEAAPLSTETIGIQWGLNTTNIGLTGSNPGDGSANTAYIISWLNVSLETNRAAQVANAVTTGGYTWFLPSLGELKKMHTNLQSGTDENGQTFTSLGIFAAAFYWSSTENNTSTAYVINFSNGGQGTHGKDGSFSGLSNYRVRAARRF